MKNVNKQSYHVWLLNISNHDRSRVYWKEYDRSVYVYIYSEILFSTVLGMKHTRDVLVLVELTKIPVVRQFNSI